MFDTATFDDWKDWTLHNDVVKAIIVVGDILSYVPAPENPEFDARFVEEGAEVARYVYRALKPEEVEGVIVGKGIVRPMPRAGKGTFLTKHIFGNNKDTTPWISTNKSLDTAKWFANHGGKSATHNPIIVIDLLKLNSMAIDVSTKELALKYINNVVTRAWAVKHKEVTVFGNINSKAIITHPYQ